MITKPKNLSRASAIFMTVFIAIGMCQSSLASGLAAKKLEPADVDLPFAPAIAERLQPPITQVPAVVGNAVVEETPAIALTVTPKSVKVVKVDMPETAGNPPTTVNLQPGKTVASQLGAMGIASGWYLVWDAPDFTIEQAVPVSSDFILAVTALIESASTNGANLKATFYRGNNTVRVTEF